jgi:hypothetical protein
VNWAWVGPLLVAGLGAGGCAAFSLKVRRETERLRLARVELRRVQSGLRDRPGAPGVRTGPAE